MQCSSLDLNAIAGDLRSSRADVARVAVASQCSGPGTSRAGSNSGANCDFSVCVSRSSSLCLVDESRSSGGFCLFLLEQPTCNSLNNAIANTALRGVLSLLAVFAMDHPILRLNSAPSLGLKKQHAPVVLTI